jgi:hypothetical protein
MRNSCRLVHAVELRHLEVSSSTLSDNMQGCGRDIINCVWREYLWA